MYDEKRLHKEVAARLLVFFFQAEDGIRDVAVTGVQKCALPIFQDLQARIQCGQDRKGEGPAVSRGIEDLEAVALRERISSDFIHYQRATISNTRCIDHIRSEERRVGKE